MKVLTVVVTKEDPLPCRKSAENQTIPTDVVIADGVFKTDTWQRSLVMAINQALAFMRWREYDWVVRVNGDDEIQPNFIEENLKAEADIIGTGNPMLLKTEVLEAMGGWPYHPLEDYHIALLARKLGFKNVPLRMRPVSSRPYGIHYDFKKMFDEGWWSYQLGREPLQMMMTKIKWAKRTRRPILFYGAMAGYLMAILRRAEPSDVFDYTVRDQVGILARHLR